MFTVILTSALNNPEVQGALVWAALGLGSAAVTGVTTAAFRIAKRNGIELSSMQRDNVHGAAQRALRAIINEALRRGQSVATIRADMPNIIAEAASRVKRSNPQGVADTKGDTTTLMSIATAYAPEILVQAQAEDSELAPALKARVASKM